MPSKNDRRKPNLSDPPPDDGAFDGFCADLTNGLSSPIHGMPGEYDAETYLRAILPLSRAAGITRVGDITGLDRIGLPVVQAVRPAALSEVTSLGRGLTVAQAAIGAVMEALERVYAEDIAPQRIFRATADELGVADGLFEPLLTPEHVGDWRQVTIPWIQAVDVATGIARPVPLELVHTRYTHPPPPGDGLFLRTTTGLACHSTAINAFRHGLFECLERDAIARAFTMHGFFDRMRIATHGLGKTVDRIVSLAAGCGVSFALWRAPSPAGLPVIWCQAIEAGPAEPLLSLPTEGYAAGPTIAAAASSAMLEALSARAGAISGARDDQTSDHYRTSTDRLVENARSLILDKTRATEATEDGSWLSSTLTALVERVAGAGVGPIYAVPVGADRTASVYCVRTILAGAQSFSIIR